MAQDEFLIIFRSFHNLKVENALRINGKFQELFLENYLIMGALPIIFTVENFNSRTEWSRLSAFAAYDYHDVIRDLNQWLLPWYFEHCFIAIIIVEKVHMMLVMIPEMFICFQRNGGLMEELLEI